MVRFYTAVLFIIASLASTAHSQTTADPKHEFRSFWLTTASALDWPRGSTPAEQQASLREILQRAKAMGMNAVVFQISSRGDAYYRSERLPWSSQLTGVIGRDPGWDPLQFAIDESRALGMELHAWFNVFNIGSATVTEPGAPQHITQFAPATWIRSASGGTWLNPGFTAGRDWVLGNIIELLSNYDVDAINFDFIRYPQGAFTDDETTRSTNNPNNIANVFAWRRDNVTDISRRTMQWVQANKPWIKVGSAPIGHYRTSGGWPALYAYSDVFQDSRSWLRDGWNDFIMPQIYWKIYSGPYTSSPEHSWIVRDYAKETYGRHVYVGIGAYVDGTIQQLPAMIDTSRVNGLKGQVYFRWGSIYAFSVQTGSIGPQITYRRPAILPSMSWRSQVAPGQPVVLSHSRSGQDVTLTWEPVSFNDNGDSLVRYAVYRVVGTSAPDPEVAITDVQNLVTVTGGTSLVNRLPNTEQNVYYIVTALSRNHIESLPSQPYVVPTSTSIEPDSETPYVTGLEPNYPNPFNPTTTLAFTLDAPRATRMVIYDLLGREVAVLADGAYPAGRHEVVFDAGNLNLASGVYVTVLRVGDQQFTRRITLLK